MGLVTFCGVTCITVCNSFSAILLFFKLSYTQIYLPSFFIFFNIISLINQKNYSSRKYFPLETCLNIWGKYSQFEIVFTLYLSWKECYACAIFFFHFFPLLNSLNIFFVKPDRYISKSIKRMYFFCIVMPEKLYLKVFSNNLSTYAYNIYHFDLFFYIFGLIKKNKVNP